MIRTEAARSLPQPGQWNGQAGLLALQEEYLPDAVRGAARCHVNRERLDIAGTVEVLSDLDRVPMIDKQCLREEYPLGLLAVGRDRVATYHESSGTSGTPTASYFTEADWYDVVDRFTRNGISVTSADTLMVRTPYAMLTTGHQAHLGGLYQGAMVVPADNRSSVVTHARVVQLLRDLDVTVAWSLPTECLLWAASARANGLRPERDFPHLRGFLVAGEPLTVERRALISELWGGVPVYQDYGSTETGSLAGECGYGRLHLWADRFVPQVLDPVTGRSASTGTGELVITTLFREAMPLLRYNLRDRVRIADDDCRCGLGLPILEVLGRTEGDAVVAGTRITPQVIERAVFALPRRFGVLFWRARSVGTHLEVQFEVSEAHRDTAARQLRTEIADATGVESSVTAVPEGTFVPSAALTGLPEFTKPRNLFGETEDWDRAVTYW